MNDGTKFVHYLAHFGAGYDPVAPFGEHRREQSASHNECGAAQRSRDDEWKLQRDVGHAHDLKHDECDRSPTGDGQRDQEYQPR